MKLDEMYCNVCGKQGCASWSLTEGSRCHPHSTYTLSGRSEDWPSEFVRRAMVDAELAAVGGNPAKLTAKYS